MTEADEKIQGCIEKNASFLLDAGAGSGKTASLVRALNHIRGHQRADLVRNSQHVACITFTNVAKNEIAERTEHDALFVISTIHDFLWEAIKSFQKELKVTLLAHNDQLPAKSRRKVDAAELAKALVTVPRVAYSDTGSKFIEGRIFHDDLLDIALLMFERYPVLSKITGARFPYIFVDEYQDTNKNVISILLRHVIDAPSKPVIGFFGDKAQSIYSDGVGEIPADLQKRLMPIKKAENYRCSLSVIRLLNKIRTDITQVPAGENKQGTAVYINLGTAAKTDDPIAQALDIANTRFGWGEREGTPRVLFLTHRLIARRAGYGELWQTYDDRGGFHRDRFQAGEDSISKFFIERIEALIEAWTNGRAGKAITILSLHGQIVASAADKKRVTDALNRLVELATGEATIREVLEHIERAQLVPLLDDLAAYLKHPPTVDEAAEADADPERAFFEGLFKVHYREVSSYRRVLERNLPYSTKHGVKGDEFDRVIVVLDDAGANWNQYSFGNFLTGADKSESRLLRTRNLFYVSCSRAKVDLAVVDLGSAVGKEDSIKAMFGEDEVAFA